MIETLYFHDLIIIIRRPFPIPMFPKAHIHSVSWHRCLSLNFSFHIKALLITPLAKTMRVVPPVGVLTLHFRLYTLWFSYWLSFLCRLFLILFAAFENLYRLLWSLIFSIVGKTIKLVGTFWNHLSHLGLFESYRWLQESCRLLSRSGPSDFIRYLTAFNGWHLVMHQKACFWMGSNMRMIHVLII